MIVLLEKKDVSLQLPAVYSYMVEQLILSHRILSFYSIAMSGILGKSNGAENPSLGSQVGGYDELIDLL